VAGTEAFRYDASIRTAFRSPDVATVAADRYGGREPPTMRAPGVGRSGRVFFATQRSSGCASMSSPTRGPVFAERVVIVPAARSIE
jgi:hypothetical protein